MDELKTISYTLPKKYDRKTQKVNPTKKSKIDVKNLLSEIFQGDNIVDVKHEIPYSNLKNNNSNRPTYREYVANNFPKTETVPKQKNMNKTHNVGKNKGKITIRIGTKKNSKQKSLSNKHMLKVLRRKSLITNTTGAQLPSGMVENMYNNSTEVKVLKS